VNAAVLIAIATQGHPNLLAVLAQIMERPHHVVVVDRPLVPVHEVGQADDLGITEALGEPTALIPIDKPPAHLTWQGQDFRFAQMVDVRPRTTVDTEPNRFLCFVVRRYRRALRKLDATPEIDRIVGRCDSALGRFQDMSPMQTLSVGHPVLQHDPLYRRVLHAHLALSRTEQV